MRVVRFLLIVDNHSLNIAEHVLSLAITTIFHLALLDALHAAHVLADSISMPPMVFLIIALITTRSLLMASDRGALGGYVGHSLPLT